MDFDAMNILELYSKSYRTIWSIEKLYNIFQNLEYKKPNNVINLRKLNKQFFKQFYNII